MAKKVVATPSPSLQGDLDMLAIGHTIRHQRTSLGMTLVDAAALSNLSKQTYQNIEQGQPTVKVESLLKACKALGVRLSINKQEESGDEWI
jgi:transcriptional regulator with XRE-family HTH domain